MVRIALDAMGGDFAPNATALGSILAAKELPKDVKLVLIGYQDLWKDVLCFEPHILFHDPL